MKKTKRLLAVLLSGLLLFATACGGSVSPSGGGSGGKNTGAEPGRYVETDITPLGEEDEPQDLHLFHTGGDNLVCFSSDLSRRWDSADGGDSWTESPGPTASLEDVFYINSATLCEDGSVIAYGYQYYDLEAGAFNSGLFQFSADGIMQQLSLPEYDEHAADGYVGTLQALPGGRLLLGAYWGGYSAPTTSEEDDETDDEDEDNLFNATVDMDSYGRLLAVFDLATGQKLYDVGNDLYAENTACDEENLYIYTGEDVQAFDLATGTRKDISGNFIVNNNLMAFYTGFAAADGLLYYVDNESLQALNPADSKLETLLHGTAHSFGNPESSAAGLHVLGSQRFVMRLYGEGSTLLRYDWDPDATYDPDKSLRIWSMENNSTIRAGISALRRKHPDALIEYEIGDPGDTGLEKSDIIQALNVQILAGNGPDVIVLDGLPMDSYVKQGVLADLTSLVDTSDVYTQLLSTLGENSAYYVPSRFNMPMLIGGENTLAGIKTLEDLVSYVTSRPAYDAAVVEFTSWSALPENERPALEFTSLAELFDALWGASAGEVLKDGELNSDALARFLTALESISAHYNLGAIDPDAEPNAVMGFYSGGSGSSMLSGSALNYLIGRSNIGVYALDDLMMLTTIADEVESDLTPLPGLTEAAWIPDGLLGITENSANKDFAAEFVSTMLSDEVQGTRTAGLPVTKGGMQKQIDYANTILEQWSEYDEERNEDDPIPTFDFDIDGMVAGLTAPAIADAEVYNKVYSNAVLLCQGEQTVEESVKTIEQEIKNYLAERK